jgi:hypothetical protein
LCIPWQFLKSASLQLIGESCLVSWLPMFRYHRVVLVWLRLYRISFGCLFGFAHHTLITYFIRSLLHVSVCYSTYSGRTSLLLAHNHSWNIAEAFETLYIFVSSQCRTLRFLSDIHPEIYKEDKSPSRSRYPRMLWRRDDDSAHWQDRYHGPLIPGFTVQDAYATECQPVVVLCVVRDPYLTCDSLNNGINSVKCLSKRKPRGILI